MPKDRHRHATATLLTADLVGLCAWYAWRAGAHSIGYTRCLETPAACEGALLELSLWRVSSVEPGLYRLTKVERDVQVMGPTEGLTPGDTVSLRARFDPERRTLVEVGRELHHHRPHKAVLGLLGALGFLLYGALTMRWRHGRLVLRA